MKTNSIYKAIKTHPTTMVCAIAAILASYGEIACSATTYKVTDLSLVSGGGIKGITPYSINAKGFMSGTSDIISSKRHTPVIYDSFSGKITRITSSGNEAFWSYSLSNINDNGQVAVTWRPKTSLDYKIFVRNPNGSRIDLVNTPNAGYDTFATELNNSGKGIASNYPRNYLSNLAPQSLYMDINGTGFQPLQGLGLGTPTQAIDINEIGQVVGKSAQKNSPYHAFLRTDTGIKDLHPANIPGESAAHHINDNGLIVGEFEFGNTGIVSRQDPQGTPIYHAILWDSKANTYIDLGNGTTNSTLHDINSAGIAVGNRFRYSGKLLSDLYETTLPGTERALVGNAKGGRLTDLNLLLAGQPRVDWQIVDARRINDNGLILADAKVSNPHLNTGYAKFPVLLTPTTTVSGLPTAPTALKASVANNQINLDWINNATVGQIVERCQGSGCTGFVPIAHLTADKTSFANKGLLPNSVYQYRVKADGNPSYSNSVKATTLSVLSNILPKAPKALTVSLVGAASGQVILNWLDLADNELNYDIERCEGFGTNCVGFAQVAKTDANITSVSVPNSFPISSNSSVGYRVRAVNAVGSSSYSNTVAVSYIP